MIKLGSLRARLVKTRAEIELKVLARLVNEPSLNSTKFGFVVFAPNDKYRRATHQKQKNTEGSTKRSRD